MFKRFTILLASAALAVTPAHAQDAEREGLLEVLAEYEPGSAISEDMLARVDAAASALEKVAGPVDLTANGELADGLWVTRFSSQGLVGEMPVSFMTRTLPGGGAEGGTARVEGVWQELRLEDGFYRNTMLLSAGPQEVAVFYIATAKLAVSPEAPEDLQVAFREILFAPGHQSVSPPDVRAALALGDQVPLAITIPEEAAPPPSASKVTYLDGGLRINRGTNYIAVMEKVR